jgi:hypothetical protein
MARIAQNEHVLLLYALLLPAILYGNIGNTLSREVYYAKSVAIGLNLVFHPAVL